MMRSLAFLIVLLAASTASAQYRYGPYGPIDPRTGFYTNQYQSPYGSYYRSESFSSGGLSASYSVSPYGYNRSYRYTSGHGNYGGPSTVITPYGVIRRR